MRLVRQTLLDGRHLVPREDHDHSPLRGHRHLLGLRGYPHKEEPEIYAEEIEEYLQVRRSVAPFPWLKARREKLLKELTEELHKPERVQKWIESGHDVESYLSY